jgi:uncharacterized protein with beta-barrel porin domain
MGNKMNKKIIALLSTVSMLTISSAFADNNDITELTTSSITLNNNDSLIVEAKGTIDTSATSSTVAVDVNGASFITNNGLIKADSASGISINNSLSSVTVSGDITNNGNIIVTNNSFGANSYGIYAYGSTINGSIINSGTISATSLLNAYGIYIDNTTSITKNIVNSGTISATSSIGAYGIQTGGNGITITNTGTIKASNGTSPFVAVDFTEGGSEQNSNNNILNTSGTIIGDIIFGNGSGNVLNACGSGTLHASGVYTATSCGGTVLRNDNLVATVDFVGTSQLTQQTTSSVSDVLYNQLNNTENRYKNGHDYYYWAEGFGSYQQRPSVKGASQTNSIVGGILVGMDKQHNDKMIVGIYAGGLKGKMKILDDTNKTIRTNGAIIGAYGSLTLPQDSFLDFNVPITYVDNISNRSVKYNLAPNGVEYEKGSFDEYDISPSVTLGKNFEYSKFTLVPSITANYIGQYIKGYTETGGVSVQTIKSRYVNTIGGTAQVALQRTLSKNSEQPIELSANFGIRGMQELGGRKIDMVLIGQEYSYTHGGPAGNLDAIAGLSVNRGLMKKGMNIFAQVQGSKGITNASAHNYKIALDAGVEVKF